VSKKYCSSSSRIVNGFDIVIADATRLLFLADRIFCRHFFQSRIVQDAAAELTGDDVLVAAAAQLLQQLLPQNHVAGTAAPGNGGRNGPVFQFATNALVGAKQARRNLRGDLVSLDALRGEFLAGAVNDLFDFGDFLGDAHSFFPQSLLGGGNLAGQGFGFFHAINDLVFSHANLFLGEGDFIAQGAILIVGLNFGDLFLKPDGFLRGQSNLAF
jgi:hypothetical protein